MLEFSKAQRLLYRQQFTDTMNVGYKIVTPHLVIIGRCNGVALSRVGFIVSKKVGGAVTRNLVKRRLREIFRTNTQQPKGLDLVVIARGLAAEAEFGEVAQSFQKALAKLQQRLQPPASNPGAGSIRPRVLAPV